MTARKIPMDEVVDDRVQEMILVANSKKKSLMISILFSFVLLWLYCSSEDKGGQNNENPKPICGKDGYKCSCEVRDTENNKFLCQECLSGFCKLGCENVVDTLKGMPYKVSATGTANFETDKGCSPEQAYAKCANTGSNFNNPTNKDPILRIDIYYYRTNLVPKGEGHQDSDKGFGTVHGCEMAQEILAGTFNAITFPGTYSRLP